MINFMLKVLHFLCIYLSTAELVVTTDRVKQNYFQIFPCFSLESLILSGPNRLTTARKPV